MISAGVLGILGVVNGARALSMSAGPVLVAEEDTGRRCGIEEWDAFENDVARRPISTRLARRVEREREEIVVGRQRVIKWAPKR